MNMRTKRKKAPLRAWSYCKLSVFVWTVGRYLGSRWCEDSRWSAPQTATIRVDYLNGGGDPSRIAPYSQNREYVI